MINLAGLTVFWVIYTKAITIYKSSFMAMLASNAWPDDFILTFILQEASR